MDFDGQSRAPALNRSAVRVFFAARWRGAVPLLTLFGRDMLVIGTLINLTTTVLSLTVLASGAPFWMGMAVFLSPMPYNLFLFLCVWRSAERLGGLGGTAICVAAALWLLGASLI